MEPCIEGSTKRHKNKILETFLKETVMVSNLLYCITETAFNLLISQKPTRVEQLKINNRLTWKNLSETNTLAYFTPASMTKNKQYFNIDTVGCILSTVS